MNIFADSKLTEKTEITEIREHNLLSFNENES